MPKQRSSQRTKQEIQVDIAERQLNAAKEHKALQYSLSAAQTKFQALTCDFNIKKQEHHLELMILQQELSNTD